MELVQKNPCNHKKQQCKLSFKTKLDIINALQPMAFLQHLPRATRGNLLDAVLVKVKLNVTFWFLLPVPLDISPSNAGLTQFCLVCKA